MQSGRNYIRDVSRVRRGLVCISIFWLTAQCALLLTPSLILLAAVHQEATECSCAHGAHAMCPMHHRATPGSKICFIGSVNGDLATLGSLFQVGLVPSVGSVSAPPVVTATSIDLTSTITLRPVPPDPPPPRV
jgi:hypothetical protein